MKKNAVFDKTGKYRYLLYREWDPALPKLLYVMLNPSIADETDEDQTSKQCLYFAKTLGYGSFEVVNLYSLISTDPKNLKTSIDPIDPIGGTTTDWYILNAASKADKIIVAWGCNHFFNKRDKDVTNLLKKSRYQLFCLGKTTDGHPRHPSRLGHKNCKLIKF